MLEGASFVVLLFVAMPLKYAASMPLAVRVVGALHGVLFLVFLAALFHASFERRWGFGRAALAFASSIVPFGTFVFDKSLRREMESLPSS